jgi:predicted GNAT family acetyltransferase
MTTELENPQVRDNEAENRFEMNLGDKSAFVTYAKSPNFITYYHTEVPPEYEGQGIAKKLAVHVLDYARENDLKVNALCPFIAAYVKRHPDYKDLLSTASRKHIFGE